METQEKHYIEWAIALALTEIELRKEMENMIYLHTAKMKLRKGSSEPDFSATLNQWECYHILADRCRMMNRIAELEKEIDEESRKS